MCGNRLKRWKMMPMSRRFMSDLVVLELVQLVALLAVADQLPVDVQPAGVDLLQVVDAPQEGRLAGAGGADEAEDLAGPDLQVDALEDLDRAEGLVDAFGLHHRRTGNVFAGFLLGHAVAPFRLDRDVDIGLDLLPRVGGS